MTPNLRKTSGLFKDFFTIIIMNREFNYTCQKKSHFPIPLKYIDVIRSTHTDLDVAQEKRIDDYWNVDEKRNLSDSRTCFTRFTLLNETPPKGHMWSEGTDKNPNDITSRSHMAWRFDKNWKSHSERRKTRMGNRETETRTRQTIERSLFYWSECDEEYKDIIKNAKRKLETSKAAAMPCKRAFPQAFIPETVVSKTEKKAKASEARTRFSFIIEAHEPKRKRIESVTKKVSSRTHRGMRTEFCIALQSSA